MALLELEGISKKYVSAEGVETPFVLENLSLKIDAGESLAITGPSGCGKSTLLNLIGTLDQPTEGRILWQGEDLSKFRPSELAKIRNQQIGFVFQSHHLLPQCTVLENVLVPTLVAKEGSPPKEVRSRAERLLKRVGLGDRLSYRPGLLSGGECQRAAVVRSLINQPQLLLADEPTGALDRKSSENLADLLCELNKEENVTLIVVTHTDHLASRMKSEHQLQDGHLIAGYNRE